MYGYKIKFNGLPKIKWACETQITGYEWHNTHSPDTLELGITSGKEFTLILNGKEFKFKDFLKFGCVVSGDDRHCYSSPDTVINSLSVAADLHNLSVICAELNENDTESTEYILLPAFAQDLADGDMQKIDSLIHLLIKEYTKQGFAAQMSCCSLFLELLCVTDSATRRILSSKGDIINYYVKKTEHILQKDFHKKLTETMIAQKLGITPVYLSSMYKNATGTNISDRLLEIRMTHAKRLLCDPNIPVRRVAELCGFCDECYFRKKFKSYMGISIREYRLIKRGLTLYHDLPVKESYTEEKE